MTRRARQGRSRPPRARAWLALCGCAALLSACADFEAYLNPPPEPPAPPPPKQHAPPQAALPAPAPTPQGPPKPSRKPVPPPPGLTAARPPADAVDAAVPPVPGPEALRGLRPEEVANVLGDPWQRAESAPATVWRYVTRSCELDLYFYLDLQSRVTRVLDIDLRPPDYGGERCLEQLVAERRAREGASSGASGPR